MQSIPRTSPQGMARIAGGFYLLSDGHRGHRTRRGFGTGRIAGAAEEGGSECSCNEQEEAHEAHGFSWLEVVPLKGDA